MLNVRAFTLIELLITISLIAILSLLAIPFYKNFIVQAESERYLAALSSSIQFARQEAIKRNMEVTICGIDAEQQCSAEQEWSQGYMIYLNLSDQTKQILKYFSAPKLPAHLTVSLKGKPNTMNISSDGSMDYQNGTFSYIVEGKSVYNWKLIISSSGRIRVEKIV